MNLTLRDLSLKMEGQKSVEGSVEGPIRDFVKAMTEARGWTLRWNSWGWLLK